MLSLLRITHWRFSDNALYKFTVYLLVYLLKLPAVNQIVRLLIGPMELFLADR